jgi:uncharacterized membrane protein YphA (DoxX/SURF4 family)
MRTAYAWFDRIDRPITHWMGRYGIRLLRISLGVVFLWFGVLKFFPGLSPAQDLAARTIITLSFGLVPASFSVPFLAAWECVIGLGLIFRLYLRATLFLLFLQMLGTIAPLVLFHAKPGCFSRSPLRWKASTTSRTLCWSAPA